MKPGHTTALDKPILNAAISIIPINFDGVRSSTIHVSNSIPGSERSCVNKHEAPSKDNSKECAKDHKQAKDRKNYQCLSIETIRKMIKKFLFKKRIIRKELVQPITKKELARALVIDIEILDKILLRKRVDRTLIAKINLPLIKLYCATRFED